MMGSATRIQNEVVDVLLLASVTDTVICQLPIAPGVPLICPLDETDRPAVLAFGERRYVYGGQPPETLTCIGEMASFLDAATSAIDERDRGGQVTVIVNDSVSVLRFVSAAVSITVCWPGVDGAVPVMGHVRLVGETSVRLPIVTHDGSSGFDKVIGGHPPFTVAVSETEPPTVTVTFEIGSITTSAQGLSTTSISKVTLAAFSLWAVSVAFTVTVCV